MSGYHIILKRELHYANVCTNCGYPVGKKETSGESVVTKEEYASEMKNIQTVTAQSIYEVQRPLYYNSDVAARSITRH